jgi:hypothetical protein
MIPLPDYFMILERDYSKHYMLLMIPEGDYFVIPERDYSKHYMLLMIPEGEDLPTIESPITRRLAIGFYFPQASFKQA